MADQMILEALYFDILAGISIRSSLKKISESSTLNAHRARVLLNLLELKNQKIIYSDDDSDLEIRKAILDIEINQLRPLGVVSMLRNHKKMKEDFRRRSRAMTINPRMQFSLMICFFLIVALNFWTQNSTDAPRFVLYAAIGWFFFGGIVFFRMARSFKWRI